MRFSVASERVRGTIGTRENETGLLSFWFPGLYLHRNSRNTKMEPSEKKEKSTVPRTNHGPLRSGLHIARFYELRRMHVLVCGTLSATARQPTLLVPTTPTLPTTHPHPHPPHTRTHSLPGPRDVGSVWFSTVGPRAATRQHVHTPEWSARATWVMACECHSFGASGTKSSLSSALVLHSALRTSAPAHRLPCALPQSVMSSVSAKAASFCWLTPGAQ